MLAMGGSLLTFVGIKKVVTVFGTCAWTARPEQFDLEQLTQINQQEDYRAVAAAGCTLELYDYPEALLRGYRKWNPKRRHTSDTTLMNTIGTMLVTHVENAQHIYFPIAPGPHVDHKLLCDLLPLMMHRFADSNKVFYAYEDLPYSWYGGLDERLMSLRKKFKLTPTTRDISAVIDQKVSILAGYKTQLAQSDIDKVREYAASLVAGGYGERVWRLAQK